MGIENELADLAEIVREQVAQGIARDLAIKLLAGLVSQMVNEDQFKEVVLEAVIDRRTRLHVLPSTFCEKTLGTSGSA